MLTQQRLKELFLYNPDTGIFQRIIAMGSRGKAGDFLTGKDLHGYIVTSVDNKEYKVHRLAWLYMTGEFPKLQIDHINCVRNDNRWSNLREADSLNNKRNVGIMSHNKSGYKGVSFNKKRKKWCAFISINNKTKGLGSYDTRQEAAQAYKSFAQSLHGLFFHKTF